MNTIIAMRIFPAIPLFFLLSLAGCGKGFFTKDTGGGGGSTSHHLYAASGPQGANGTVTGLDISATGLLTSLGTSAAVGISPSAIAITPNNQFLYVANQNGNINAFSIASTGALTAVPNQPFAPGTNPIAMKIDPAGKFMYVLNLASNTVSAFRIQADGSLQVAQAQSLPLSASPFDLSLTPSGNFLYVAGQTDTFIFQIGTDSNGNNTYSQVTCTPSCTIASQVVLVHTNGSTLYVSDGKGQISSFSLSSTGVPTAVGAPITGLASPVSFALDSTGNFLLVLTSGDNNLTSFAILQNGSLSKVTSVKVGSKPVQVRVDPGSNTAFVANSGGSPDVSGFTVSSAGQFTVAGTASIGGSATALAVTH